MKINFVKILKLSWLATLIFLFSSCQPKRLGEAVFDLNDFSFGLSVSRFYESELKKENSEKVSSYSDTSYSNESGKSKAVAVRYIVSAEKLDKPFAKLKNINFYNLKSVSDINDNLMMISAEASCGFGEQIRLVSDLTKEHGEPVVKQHISSFTSFTWLVGDRTIQAQCEMIPAYENDKNKRGDFLNPNGGFLKSDSYEPNHVWKMLIYIFNDKYTAQLTEEMSFIENMSGLKPYFYDYTGDTKARF